MVNIGFIGCHKISDVCLKKICELASEYGDHVKTVFNLTSNEGSKHSYYADFSSLQKKYDFPLHFVIDVSDKENIQKMLDSKLDILFIIGWHRIVPQSVLDVAKIKLGIHSSLLPKERGSSPINWQIIRGDIVGGVTLFHLTTGVDSGPIVDQEQYSIDENDDVKTVYSKAIDSSLNLLEKNWHDIHNLNPKNIPQNESDVTFNKRRTPNDGIIDWSKSSKQCYDWIRALTFPYPGAFTYWNGKKILIWKSNISKTVGNHFGEILDISEKILVTTGDGSIEISLLQIEGEPLCNAEVFKNSYKIQKGDTFTSSINSSENNK